MRAPELHDAIATALEFDVYDHGDAVAIVQNTFATVADILARHPRFAGVSRFEIELLFRDTQLKAEAALAEYCLPNPELDAIAIADAILDADAERSLGDDQ